MTETPRSASVRELFLLGLLTVAPLVVTLWILGSVINTLDEAIYAVIPVTIEPRFFGYRIPGLGMIVTFLLVVAIGALAKTISGNFLAQTADRLFGHIPFVRALYSTAKQISNVFFSENSKSAFKKVVYVPFAGARTLAFVSSKPSPAETMVFVPTAPNPTSGYVCVFNDAQLEACPMSVEEALKLILSCGAVTTETPA